jgi:hypothetical protein
MEQNRAGWSSFDRETYKFDATLYRTHGFTAKAARLPESQFR